MQGLSEAYLLHVLSIIEYHQWQLTCLPGIIVGRQVNVDFEVAFKEFGPEMRQPMYGDAVLYFLGKNVLCYRSSLHLVVLVVNGMLGYKVKNTGG